MQLAEVGLGCMSAAPSEAGFHWIIRLVPRLLPKQNGISGPLEVVSSWLCWAILAAKQLCRAGKAKKQFDLSSPEAAYSTALNIASGLECWSCTRASFYRIQPWG